MNVADLYEGTLTADQLEQLFDDLERTEFVQALVKGGATARARPSTLAGVRRAMAEGARAIQVAYRHDGDLWLDTLMAIPDGARLVRRRT